MSVVANSPAHPFVSAASQGLPRVAPRLDRNSLAGWATLALGLIAAIIWATETGDTSSLVRAMNFILPTYFLTIMPFVAYLLVRADPKMIWTPIVLFLAHTALFKGLGPLVFQFGNAETMAYINDNIWARTHTEQLQTNILNAVATSVIIVSACFVMRVRSVRRFAQEKRNGNFLRDQKIMMKTALAFLFLGFINRYAIVLPYEWGLTDTPPPGIASTLKNLIDLGIALIAYLSVRRGGSWTILFWIVFPMHVLTLMLEFRKSVVMLAILLPAFTAYLAHGKPRRLIAWILSGALIFVLITPFANYGREMIIARGGEDVYNASLGDRVGIVENVLSNPDAFLAAANERARQNSWLRLDYSGPQAYVMHEFDRGIVNPTLLDGLWRLVPRAIWPDKPTTSGPGRWFYQYVTSSDRQARVGVTFYADAYWNGGWTAVVLVCGGIGALFGVATALVMRWLRSSDFIMFPAILLIADFALRGLNGWIQNGFALIPYLMVYGMFVYFIRKTARL
ncbi:hypothetical protein [Roseovarius sp.]|uniref:hypothetical protein n=1 Tax=Roseovarius sp. TaxID=1486281 RepID=UPI00356637D6